VTSRTKKIIACALATTVITVFGFIATSAYAAWHKFAIEDQIHAMFYPVVAGLSEFRNDTGSAAIKLTDITPKYIPKIPNLDIVDKIIYTRSPDGQDWELSLYSTALNPHRYYVARSSQKYTESEEKKIIMRYHSIWTVLKEQ
jgi:hypothetical protein